MALRLSGQRAWLRRIAGLFPNNRRQRDLADELSSHLQLHIDDNLSAGMTEEQARRAAVLKLGGVESTKEAVRDRATIPFLEHLWQDIRFAIRQFRKNPAFTWTAILMLALGMCASVAIFAFVDAALIKPLPYRDPASLVGVYEKSALFPRDNLSYPDYLDWKRLNRSFSSLDVYTDAGFLLTGRAGAEPVHGARVTAGFFQTLGVTPVLGRAFHPGEDTPAAPRAVLLSYAAWRNRYAGRRDILGQTVTLNGQPNIIVGVLPPGFHFSPAGAADFWTAFHPTAGYCDFRRSCHSIFAVARLKAGVGLAAASADVKAIAQQLERQYPDSNHGQSASLVPLTEAITGDMRPILLLLLGGAGLLLLIANVNVTSLLLVRAESRHREMAVRNALGASSGRLLSQYVTEAVLLVSLGSVLGLMAAYWLIHLLVKLIPPEMLAGLPFLEGLNLNPHTIWFAAALASASAALFALVPVLRFNRSGAAAGLAEGSRGSAGVTWRRLGSRLVVLELATALVLLAGAGLLGQSLYHLLHVSLGMQPDRLATIGVGAPEKTYATGLQQIALARQIFGRLSNLPGVKSVAVANKLPVTGNGDTDWIRFLGRPYNGEHNNVNEREVGATYFTTIGATLLRGRYFTDAEDLSKPRVVIINKALVKKYFPGEDPIGKKIGDDALSPKSMKTIIGIVDDIREAALDGDIWPAVYYPFNQNTDNYFNVIVRTSQSSQSLLPTLRAAIRRIDPGIVTFDGTTMNALIENSQSAYLHRSSAWLVGGFAALALLLSIVGLYGVTAYSVSQRTREIGVRMALGAQPRSVYRLILREAVRLASLGIAIGLVSAVLAGRLMHSLLFGVRSWDLSTLIAVAALLAMSALLASYLPARRAASVNPVDALRAE